MNGEFSPSKRLPINRKERYYAATALPALISTPRVGSLENFLTLCGLTDCTIDGTLQFFTEYGFAESLVTETDVAAWPGTWNRDTPDLVLRGPDWLVVVEAKFFLNPSAQQLADQMLAQAPLVDKWREQLGVPKARCKHVLLLPEQLVERIADGQTHLHHQWPIVTWQGVLAAYSELADNYWHRTIAEALEAYDDLVSQAPPSGSNADARMTGQEIVATWGAAPWRTMGRNQGLSGAALTSDIESGNWVLQQYEVSRNAQPANRNWFPIADFISRLPKDSVPALPNGIGRPMEDRNVRALLLWRRYETEPADRWELRAFVYCPAAGTAVVHPWTAPDWDYLYFEGPQAIWDRLWGQFEYAMPGHQGLIYDFFSADSIETAIEYATWRKERVAKYGM